MAGDIMNIEKIKTLIQEKKEVKFKLYSLEYIIKVSDNVFEIFSPTYPNDVRKYNSIDDLLTDFSVYNTNLIDSQDRIIILESE